MIVAEYEITIEYAASGTMTFRTTDVLLALADQDYERADKIIIERVGTIGSTS